MQINWLNLEYSKNESGKTFPTRVSGCSIQLNYVLLIALFFGGFSIFLIVSPFVLLLLMIQKFLYMQSPNLLFLK